MSGQQQEVVKTAPPRLAEQDFEKGRSAHVEQGLGRGPGLLAEPRPEPADKDHALIAQTHSSNAKTGPIAVAARKLRREASSLPRPRT